MVHQNPVPSLPVREAVLSLPAHEKDLQKELEVLMESWRQEMRCCEIASIHWAAAGDMDICMTWVAKASIWRSAIERLKEVLGE